MNLTDRDCDVLETLTRRIRLAPVFQVVALWWASARVRSSARERLKALAAAGWLELHRINARRPTTAAPLIVWQPGDDEPDADEVAARIRMRRNFVAEPIEVCVASAAAANLFGSAACGLPAFERRDHDLRLATAYFHYRKMRPQWAARWVGEQVRCLAQLRTKTPDAVLTNSRDDVIRVIESAGDWNAPQVNAFHSMCFEDDLPYEMW